MNPSEKSHYVRPPTVAGPRGFYPAEPHVLRTQITHHLDSAEYIEDLPPFGLIAPHAGYIYSGPVAGWAYRQVVGRIYDVVVVLAPSHFEMFPFASVMPRGVYRTPLGDVPVESDVAREFANAAAGAAELSFKGHYANGGPSEHSLEVQLPFLQVALGDFKLVPVIVGGGGWDLCHRLGAALAAVARSRDVLLVASSDLSHYHDYDTAYRLDRELIARVEAMDGEGVAEGCRSRHLEACGGSPIAAVLAAADRFGARRVRILRHATSGDVPGGMRDQVVGYLAAAVYPGEAEGASTGTDAEPAAESEGSGLEFTTEEKRILLELARQAIVSVVTGKPSGGSVDPAGLTDNLKQLRGMFVTLKSEGRLRGCIGNLAPALPLHELVRDVAIQSALSDPRFPPVSPDEVDGLEIEVTVLGPMKRVESADEVVPGRHGVLIRSGGYQGLLLPQVAEEQGWGREKFLDHVCLKAGLRTGAWRDPEAEIFIFSADHFA